MVMGSVRREFELKVSKEAGETLDAIAAELGLPVEYIVSIALEWYADTMCRQEGPPLFSKWLQEWVSGHGWRVPLAG